MEAQQVTDKILADAKAAADEIKQQAEARTGREKAGLEKQLDAYKAETEEMAQQAGEDKRSHMLAAARMDIARELLAEKRSILDEVFSKARAKLKALPEDEYKKLIEKLMLDTVETGEEQVVAEQGDNRIDAQLVDKVNKALAEKGKKGELKLSKEKVGLDGGFILRRGKIKTNVSLDVLVSQARDELEIKLARELFAE